MKQEKINKLKLVKILEILRQDSDEEKPMPTKVLLNKLQEQGIVCRRQTLYEDINTLNDSGYEILCHRGISNEYYVIDRSFDVPELRVLMDAVEAAHFITENKTKELQDKIANLGGSYRKQLLLRDTVSFDVNKHNNNTIFYSVNEIEEAINDNKKITFYYFDLDYQGNKAYRKGKALYEVNPIATIFSNDNYYLVCFSDKHQNYSNYRVDRMENVKKTEEDRTKSLLIADFDMHEYRKLTFGMFAGEPTQIGLAFDKNMIDVVFDKFGENIKIISLGNDKLQATANVIISNQFYGWLFGLGESIKLIAPQKEVDNFLYYIKEINKKYL